MKRVVAKVGDIPPGKHIIVDVAGRSIGVFNIGGEFYALRNQCPHAGAPVCQGTRSAMVSSPRPGSYECSRQGEILRCPWHDWEFDIRTGQSVVEPSRLRISSYKTEIADGDELAAGLPTGFDAEGKPYQLETFPVTVEERYVLIDI